MTKSDRQKRKADFETWLLANRERIANEPWQVIATEMKRLGFYSKNTRIADIESAFYRACDRLRIKRRDQ